MLHMGLLLQASLLLMPWGMHRVWKRLVRSGHSTRKLWRYGPALLTLALLGSFLFLLPRGWLPFWVMAWLLVLCYAAYCLTVMSFQAIASKPLRVLALCLGGIPMALVAAYVVLRSVMQLAFIGVLAFAQEQEPPFHTQRMSATIECRAWHFGWGGNDSGHHLKLFRLSPQGGVGHEIARSSYIVSDASRNDPNTPSNCDELYAQYLRQQQK